MGKKESVSTKLKRFHCMWTFSSVQAGRSDSAIELGFKGVGSAEPVFCEAD